MPSKKQSKKVETPQFHHPCEKCRFLGIDIARLEEESSCEFVDMYAHSTNEGCYLLWRRFGDDEDDIVGVQFVTYGHVVSDISPAWLPLIKKVAN